MGYFSEIAVVLIPVFFLSVEDSGRQADSVDAGVVSVKTIVPWRVV